MRTLESSWLFNRGTRRSAVVIPALPLALLALSTACIGEPLPTDAVTSTPGTVEATSIQVEPRDPVVLPGQSIRFSARLRDANGTEVSGDVEWESDGGTIGADGLYVAPDRPGRRKVKANHPGRSNGHPPVVDSTWVDVADPETQPAPVRLILVPATATVDPGESFDFTATMYAEDGTQVAGEIAWSASGGEIDQTGHFVAGQEGGEFDVRAASGELSDTATVSVRTPTEEPANEAPTASFAADCTALTCTLDATSSYDSDGSVDTYAWEFGDGETGSGPTAEHTFAAAGTYTIGLAVTDDDGSTATATQMIAVEGPLEPDPDDPPVEGVEIEPGTNIQAVVDAHPAGTTYLLKAGVHVRQQIRPKNGDTFHGEPGAILDGEGGVSWAIRGGADDVTIRNLEITGYAPPVQYGAVEADWDQGLRWTVEDNEIHGNAGAGLKVGHDMTVRGNHVHHNGQIGLLGLGDRMLIENNEISYNNTDGHDPLWEAGGMKFLQSDGIVFRNNHVHHNYGTGVWFDYDNINSLIESNLIEDNQVGGIHYEISYDAVIRDNTIRRNGDGSTDRFSRSGILVFASPNVEVYGNTLEGNDQGITGLDDDRGTGEHGAYRVENLWVHDNDVTMSRGASGLGDWRGSGAVFSTSADNRFDRNTYRITGNDRPFWHGSRVDEDGWQAENQDPNGTFIR